MILLRGGTVVDGTGGAPFTADVLVRDGRIAAVERIGTAPDAMVIDCAGLTAGAGIHRRPQPLRSPGAGES